MNSSSYTKQFSFPDRQKRRSIALLTVQDVLQLPLLSSVRVVAGTRGLSRKVEHVSVMEVDLTKWCSPTLVRGAALEISSMYSLADSTERQIQAIHSLNNSGGSGLLLCYVGKVLKEISPELIRVCDELDFPLMVVPGLVGYKEIIRVISDALLGLDNKRLRDAIDIYEYVTKLLIDGRDNTSLVLALEHMIGKRVVYFDQNAQPIISSDYTAEQLKTISLYIKQYSSEFLLQHSSKTVEFDGMETPFFLCPIYNKTYYFGILAIAGDHFSDLDKVSIAQIRNALSISTLNQISALQQQEKLRSDFIRDIITGHYSEEDILRRSFSIQCNIAKVSGCIVLDIRDFKHMAENTSEDRLVQLKRQFYEQVRDELSTLASESICCSFSDKIIVLYIPSHSGEQSIFQTAKTLQRTLKGHINLEVSAGVGIRCKSLTSIQSSYETARLALRIANSSLSTSSCIDSEDFPVYVTLLKNYSADPKLLHDAVNKLLSPVRDYDANHGSSLEETFRFLLDCDMDYKAVAEKMFLHKNTVLQRKQKIASLYPEGDPFALPTRKQFEFAFVLEELYPL